MYPFKTKENEYCKLVSEVFPFQTTVYFKDHEKYQELIQLLHLSNEVSSLVVTVHPGHHRFQEEIHYVGETITEARNRAISSGTGVIHAVIPIQTHSGWTKTEYKMLDEAKTFADALTIAMKLIDNQCLSRDSFTQVCGPISTGGYGSVEHNLLAFHKTIQKLKKSRKELIFDQMPFEPLFHRFHAEWSAVHGDAYMQPVLDDFYLHLFERGHIKKLTFMHDWKSSRGAQWEHEQAERLRIPVEYLPENYITI